MQPLRHPTSAILLYWLRVGRQRPGRAFCAHHALRQKRLQLCIAHPGGLQLLQRREDKGALPHARVRHLQIGQDHHSLAVGVQQQIQIERARRVAIRAFTACGLLQLLQYQKQCVRRQPGHQLGHGIQIIRPA